jgi:murein DD-endopeptidase MepM/ murein hydrolase activator NlpD
MRPLHTLAIVCAVTLFCIIAAKQLLGISFKSTEVDNQSSQENLEEMEVQPEPEWIVHTIEKGEVLGTILPKYNLSTSTIQKAAIEIYDLSKLKIGQELQFKYMPDATSPSEIRFTLGEDSTLIITETTEGWVSKKEEIHYDVKRGYRRFIVDSSLWNAAIKGGLKARDIVQMAQVLQYDIDFNTEIHKGAEAEILVEELYQNGKFVKLGSSLVLKFTNRGEEYMAIRYKNKSGEAEYYDLQGRSRRSAFLRSPLAFSRVTSGFNPKRFHPVLKTRRPHNGTDFGAPTGTSVRSVADGVVVYAGKNGGHGNFVKIKHQSPYQTSYSHLSKINVKKGQKIKQGRVIGKVGTTGLSTGPHLHYQMWKNGRFVDAMKVKLPKSKRLSKSEMGAFKKESQLLLTEMNSLKSVAEK